MKEARDFYKDFDTCRMQDIPLCADACPFKMGILDVQERIEKKRFNAAYKTIRDCTVFPGIVSEICPAYCQKHCIRENFGGAIQIKKLEQAVINLASRRDPNSYNLPKRDVKVAVVGGGLSGMGFALKMASRKCAVTVFEAKDHIGGQLENFLDRKTYMSEFELQFRNETYELKLNAKPDKAGLIGDGYHIIYIATGEAGDDFGVKGSEIADRPDGGKTLLLTGGSLNGKDLMNALADGIKLAAVADDYLKSGVLNMPEESEPSKCVANKDNLDEAVITTTADPNGIYNENEAIAEATRCIRCQCDGCQSYCDLVEFYKKWPVKMRDEIFLSVKPAGSLVHKSPARKYIAACTDCKIMEEGACPESIELCSMIKAARHQMHAADKMPAAYKQYYVRDMEFANGSKAALVKMSSGDVSENSFAFFPGCNLGALNPDYVIKPYRWLTDNYPGTGLLLKCCGIPIDWAGNENALKETIAQLKEDWESLGKPTLVIACMSCEKHIHEYLPEIQTTTIYELMEIKCSLLDNTKMSIGTRPENSFSVFDPCSARGKDKVQEAVRKLAASAGLNTEEFPKGDLHGCCGFGGQGAVAQPEFTKHVAKKRAGMSDHPYLVYCSNCRDVFKGQGKDAIHILDALFDIDPACEAVDPDVSQRRENRIILKEKLLEEFWGEKMTNKPEELKYKLIMSEDVRDKVNKSRILTEDIVNVIERAERTGRRTRNPENGHYKAYKEIGAITLWVEYGDMGYNKREIFNIYSHRMQIKLETVFNGHKVE